MMSLSALGQRLAELPGPSPRAVGDADPSLVSISHDSRTVEPGGLFCCVTGASFDGHDFAQRAVEAGAGALLVERPLDASVPQLVVDNVRRAMGPASAAIYGDPSSALTVVGVTGTNGKTTSVELFSHVLGRVGPVDTLGTLTGARTTPEAPELQRWLAEGVARRLRYVAMEVSSHALNMHRVDGTRFRVAMFTNLGHDHLDHHGDLEAYFEAKAGLFDRSLAETAVINVDDPAGRRLADRVRQSGDVELVTVELADAEDLVAEGTRSRFRWRGDPVELHLAGRHNVLNALEVAASAEVLGVPLTDIVEGLSTAEPPPGRFELVDAGQPFTLVVDYAHTPDALSAALDAARSAAGPEGRVGVVFGCGGDRDRDKRPQMGRTAAEEADFVVLTNDNPRHEDPASILADIKAGVPATTQVQVIPDRAEAIAVAIGMANPGDVLVLAGKGHESTQVIGDTVTPFDDRAVALSVLGSPAGGAA